MIPPGADLLFDLLRQDRPRCAAAALRALTPAEWADLVDLAHSQRVAPLLLQRLRDHGLGTLPAPAPLARLELAHRSNALRGLRIYHELAQIAALARALGAPLVALKGAALAAPLYGNVALRVLGDLDVLTAADQVRPLADQLARAGYAPVEAVSAAQLAHHLPAMRRPAGPCLVELHWQLAPPNPRYQLPLAEIWPRLARFDLLGGQILGLAAEDLLLHLCVHAAYQHQLIGVGVRPLCDLAQLIATHGPQLDWDAVAERARRWGCRRGVVLTLTLADQLVGAAIPPPALRLLGAAPIGPDLLATARAQLFTAYAEELAMPAPLAALNDRPHLRDWVAQIWRRIFVSPAALATQFGVNPRSPRIYAYYPARAWVLLRRHSRSVGQLRAGAPGLRERAGRRARLSRWLAEE